MLNTGSARSAVQLNVNYTDKRGVARTARLATLKGGTSWTLSAQIMFLKYIAPVVGGQGQTWVSFKFAPAGGPWQIDDLYVDPLKSQ